MTKEKLQIIIGNNIRSQRLARNISIAKLAGLIGITHGYLGMIERGRRGFTLLKLLYFADVFDVPIDTFFRSPKNPSEDIKPPIGYTERQKISSLISDFSVKDLDFLIGTIENYRTAIVSERQIDEGQV